VIPLPKIDSIEVRFSLSEEVSIHNRLCRRSEIYYHSKRRQEIPEAEHLRKESKILVPDRNQEAAITSIQTDFGKEVEIRHELELRGGFAEMAKKGFRFTSYSTTEKE
jgi:hypothetical protein